MTTTSSDQSSAHDLALLKEKLLQDKLMKIMSYSQKKKKRKKKKDKDKESELPGVSQGAHETGNVIFVSPIDIDCHSASRRT